MDGGEAWMGEMAVVEIGRHVSAVATLLAGVKRVVCVAW